MSANTKNKVLPIKQYIQKLLKERENMTPKFYLTILPTDHILADIFFINLYEAGYKNTIN